MILNDRQIYDECHTSAVMMIRPYVYEKTKVGLLSYGPSSFGYDIRLGDHIVMYSGPEDEVWDPTIISSKVIPSEFFPLIDGYVLHPGEFVLGTSRETFHMPGDISGVVRDKSTLARMGLAVQNTVLEPGWYGELTIEVNNHGPNKIFLTAGMPIAQVQFFRGNHPKHSYDGRYNGQKGATLPRSNT